MAAKTPASTPAQSAKPARKAAPNAAARPAPKQAQAPRAGGAKQGGKRVRIKLVRSGIGAPQRQRATLRSLGLTRMNQERELADTPIVRGMIFTVRHLVIADPA